MSRIRRTTSKKDLTQHFIQGIGDGNLHSDFDLLPDASHQKRTRHHYIRTAVGSGDNHPRRRDKGDGVGIAAVDEDLQEEEEEEKNDAHDNAMLHGGRGRGSGGSISSSSSSSHQQVEDTPASSMFLFPMSPLAFLLIPLAVFLLAMAFRKEFSRRQSYKKKGPDRKLLRTESQALRQKKKTDEWEEEELDSEYNDLITRRHSLVGETNIHNDLIDDDNNNIHNNNNNNIVSVTRNPSSPCCYRRESYLRGEHARHRKVNKGITDSRQHILLNQSYHDRKITQEDSFHRMQQVSSFDHDDQELDEEALSPIARSRTFSFDDLEQRTLTVVGGSRKPIYVSSFSELTMPDLSSHTVPVEDTVSISDGNAKILEGDEDDGSVPSQECAISGETEGANGLIHKRRDLTACSDAASSLHSPIVYSDLKMNHLIGGGGFGQVWSATWRGTPVAVKVLSASSESLMVQKAILQEFVAEINMLSGMRHPNICLYIGACLEPTNRAIVTGE
jgi:Protein tyrosine kinase.